MLKQQYKTNHDMGLLRKSMTSTEPSFICRIVEAVLGSVSSGPLKMST